MEAGGNTRQKMVFLQDVFVWQENGQRFTVFLSRCLSVKKVEEEVELKKGSKVRVVTAQSEKDKTDGATVWVDYPNLAKVLEKDAKIYIDDGLIGLKVKEIGKC